MMIRTGHPWRCALPTCNGLKLGTMRNLERHHNEHLSVLSDEWKEKSICPWPDCRSRKRSTEFQNKSVFKRHLRTHFKSHWCQHPGCNYDKPFGSRYDLDRHMQSRHLYTRSFACKFPSCSSTFARKDKLDLHNRARHPTSYCRMDHCGRIVLDLDRDDHFKNFHDGHCYELGSRSTQIENGIFECALAGCESTVSRFNSASAQRHLATCHGIDYWAAGLIVRQLPRILGLRGRLNEESSSKIMTISLEDVTIGRDHVRPCSICTKNAVTGTALSGPTTNETL